MYEAHFLGRQDLFYIHTLCVFVYVRLCVCVVVVVRRGIMNVNINGLILAFGQPVVLQPCFPPLIYSHLLAAFQYIFWI